jgi:sigma-E factor negative regulatory protein RseC
MVASISHIGTVESVNDTGTVTVRIERTSSCEGCYAKGSCRTAASGSRLIEAHNTVGIPLRSGDEVTVEISRRSGFSAVAVAFILPLALVLITTVAVMTATGSETNACLAALSTLAVYYATLWLCRNKLKLNISISNNKSNGQIQSAD